MKQFKQHTKELAEAKGLVVMAFGRMNPPTIGHLKLADKVKSVAGSNPYRIYLSQKVGPKDPLAWPKKIAWARLSFGSKHAKSIMADKEVKTFIQAAEKLYKEGFTQLIMVAGSDRIKEFQTLLDRYNGKPDRAGKVVFDFPDGVTVVSSGERDPDSSDPTEAISASVMRQAAQSGDFETFKKGSPLKETDAKKLYLEVRKAMGVREVKEDLIIDSDYDALRDAYLRGEWGNIGDIVEANGFSGEIVRRGTNYLSFVDEDGKFHKAFLHQVGEDAWFRSRITDKIGGKLQRKTAPKSFEKMAKQYADLAKKPEYKGKPNLAAAQIALQYRNVNPRTLISYINDLVMQGKLPKELRANYMPTFKEATSVKQDSQIKDRPGTQPKKYYAKDAEGDEMSKSTKQARARHFEKGAAKDDDDPSAYKPAPGDKSAKTKLSKHTKKVRQMYPDLYDEARDYRKEYDNYGGKPEQIKRRSSRNKARRIMGDKAVKGMDVGHKDNNPLNNDPKNLRNEDPSTNRREPRLRESAADSSLKKKAEKSGISASILKQVYNRGVAAWRTGHRPGTTPEQWGHARVNSFISKSSGTWGGADKDLAAKAKGKSESVDLGESWKPSTMSGYSALMFAKDFPEHEVRGAFQYHPDVLEALDEQPTHEITVGDYTTKFFHMCGSAQTTMKKHADKEGAEELTIMQDVFYKMEKDAMDNGGASDEQKQKAEILYDKIMTKAEDMGIASEVDKYMKLHLTSITKGEPKLGFGRTDISESLWANIHKKRQRIKQGSGERMRKKGEKGAPTPDQIQKAQEEACCEDCETESILIENNQYRVGSEAYFEYFTNMRKMYNEGRLEVTGFDKELMEGDLGKFATYEEQVVPLDCPMVESEYQGKDVELNKPKAGGPKKYYVYVRDPSTGNVKKVTWGDTTGLKVKLDDKEARKSFAARHKCDQQKDKTKAGYWACNLPRYASQLGLSGGGNFYW